MPISVESVKNIESSFYEEDSYEFLIFYQSIKDWIIYDSIDLSYETVLSLTNNFINFHGKIPFPEDILQDFYWSAVPLGVFRYNMLEDGSCGIVTKDNSIPGLIVEGMYWFNGFYYLVRSTENILQIKLYIDSDTRQMYSYP